MTALAAPALEAPEPPIADDSGGAPVAGSSESAVGVDGATEGVALLRESSTARANTRAFSAAPTQTVWRSPSSGISQKAAHRVPTMAPAVFTA